MEATETHLSTICYHLQPVYVPYFRNKKLAERVLISCGRVVRDFERKQKLGVTFNSDKLGSVDFTKFSKLSMCSAGAGRCWLAQWPGLPPRHCTWSVLKFL